MKTIFCVRPRGFNIGNELIFHCAKHFIEKHASTEINFITIPSTKAYESGVKAGFTKDTVYEFNNLADAVFLIGGNVYENGNLDFDYYAFDKLDVPFFVFSVSRGMVLSKKLEFVSRTDSIGDSVIIDLARKAKFHLSRDYATFKYLENLGVNNVIGGCPTLFLNEIETINKNKYSNTVFISIRNLDLMNIPSQIKYKTPLQIRDICNVLNSYGYNNVKLLCHDIRDITFATSFPEMDYVYIEDIHEYIDLISNAELIISYRLHASLPRYSLNKPFINISYDERALSLFDTIGLSHWDVFITCENLMQAINDRLNKIKNCNFPVINDNTYVLKIKEIIESSLKSFMGSI